MMFITLIIGLIAGPAVSLYGSPTVSPVTAAAWAAEPLPPKLPSSMYFLALSHAPPPVSSAARRTGRPRWCRASTPPSSLGAEHEADDERSDHRQRARKDHLALRRGGHERPRTCRTRARAVPSMIPGISRNCRRTSLTTAPAARPTASMPASRRERQIPPSSSPAMTRGGAVRSKLTGGSVRAEQRLVEDVRVAREQHQGREAGGTDRVALGDRLGGVADGVERVGDLAHGLGQIGHLGDAAGVVGDRAVGVDGDDDAGHAQQRHRGDADPVQAAERGGARGCRRR